MKYIVPIQANQEPQTGAMEDVFRHIMRDVAMKMLGRGLTPNEATVAAMLLAIGVDLGAAMHSALVQGETEAEYEWPWPDEDNPLKLDEEDEDT